MTDGEMEVVTVLDIQDNAAQVQLPDTSVEVWSLASLPRGVQPGHRVGITVTDGDFDVVLLERQGGLQA